MQSGGPILFSSRAGPRALARSRPRRARPVPLTSRPRLSATPPPLLCRPTCQLSPALSPTDRACARAAHVARPRRARAAAGAARRSGPDPTSSRAPRGTPTPGTPSPLPFSPPGRAAAERIPPRVFLRAEIDFLTPLRPLSRVLEPPRHSPHPDRRLRPPEPASPSRISADLRRRPPLPGELFPELPIPGISCKSLTPSPLPSCRTSSPPPATTGAPSPPTNAAARRRLHRLTVDPPFRCASVLSSLPGAFPVTPSRPPAAPCRRRATAEPPASTPPRRPARGDRADAHAVRAQRTRRPVPPLGWAARPWPSRRSADRAWQAAAPRGL